MLTAAQGEGKAELAKLRSISLQELACVALRVKATPKVAASNPTAATFF